MIDSATTVAGLWRYPVKSMRGERVAAADVDGRGLTGDRAYAVVDGATGRVGSAKHPRNWGALLGCSARYAEAPVAGGDLPPVVITLPDGSEIGSDHGEVDDRLSAVFGRAVRLTTVAPDGNGYLAVWPAGIDAAPEEFVQQNAVPAGDADAHDDDGTVTGLTLALASPPGSFFDVAPLHVVTTETLARLGELAPDSRFPIERFRPNVVIDGVTEAFAENAWSGSNLRAGDTLTAAVFMPTMRCIMTTLAQGDLPRDNGVLRAAARHNRVDIPGAGTWACVGAYATVTEPGRVTTGDAVSLVAPA